MPDGPDSAEDNEHLPATFIYAGIDVERCGVFTGTRGRQLAGRCGLITTGAFPLGSADNWVFWDALAVNRQVSVLRLAEKWKIA